MPRRLQSRPLARRSGAGSYLTASEAPGALLRRSGRAAAKYASSALLELHDPTAAGLSDCHPLLA